MTQVCGEICLSRSQPTVHAMQLMIQLMSVHLTVRWVNVCVLRGKISFSMNAS